MARCFCKLPFTITHKTVAAVRKLHVQFYMNAIL